MRRQVITAVALAALFPAGAAVATTEPDTTPPEGAETTAPPEGAETTAPPETAPEETAAAETTAVEGTEPAPETTEAAAEEPATIFDEDGNPQALIAVTEMELGWTDYPEGDEPDEGREYVRMTVSVQSEVPEDTFDINVDHFILQDNNGFVTTGQNIRTAAQAEADEDVPDDAELEGGEAAELVVTFQVDSIAGPQSVFYRRDDDRLTDITEVS